MNKTIAVTGSSGFVGNHLISRLQAGSYNILEFDLKQGIDLTKDSFIETKEKFDIIVHLAARSFVPESFKDPKAFYFENYISTLNVLELARKIMAKVIFISSYVYGNPQYLPIDESHPLNAHNPYAQTKIIGEKLCEGYARDFNIPITIFRPFNIYGPGQNSHFLIPTILKQVKKGEVTLQDPRPKRDFIFVDDIVSAILLEIENGSRKLEIYNLGYGTSYSVSEIINIIQEVYPKNFTVRYSKEVRKNEVPNVVSNSAHASTDLNWKPKISLVEGIKKLMENL